MAIKIVEGTMGSGMALSTLELSKLARKKKVKKGCSIQHKNKIVAKKVHDRKIAVKGQGTVGLSSMGHTKKTSEMSDRDKAFLGRK